MLDPTKRFSSRVGDYVKYRPRYPQGVLDILREEVGLTAEWVLADVGSGTGFLTELFLGNGNRVFAVEPNDEMRRAAEERLGDNPLFVSIAATAEDTTLPGARVEMVTAGQAFHWFDRAKTRAEFLRILGPGGWVALIDNRHADEGSGLQGGIEELMALHSPEHEEMRARRAAVGDVADFFGPDGYTTRTCPNEQVLDLDGFKGRMTSRSTTPEPGQPGHEEVMRGLEGIFAEHSQGGKIVLAYETQVRFGRLD